MLVGFNTKHCVRSEICSRKSLETNTTEFQMTFTPVKLHKEDKEIHVGSLIFKSFTFGEGENANSYGDVMKKLDGYFKT